VIGGTPAPSPAADRRRRIQEAAKANSVVTAIIAYAITAIVALLAAYFKIFSQFIPYDDEGSVLITVRAFTHGDTLYKDIWSVYGPFYYEIFGGFFKLTGIKITTDASRTLTLLVWVVASTLFGVTAQRLSGRLWLGLTAMITAFSALTVLANEPSHPQGLSIVLIAAFFLVATVEDRNRLRRTGCVCGAMLAALILTKVNLGVYAVAGTVLAGALMVERIRRTRWLPVLVVLAFLAMPIFVLARDLNEYWVREFALMEILAGIAIVIASRPIWPRRDEDGGGTLGWVLAAIVGFVAAAVVVIIVILATGPSVKDVYDGVVKEAFGIRNVLEGVLAFPAGIVVDGAIAAVAAAWLVTRLPRPGPSVWRGVLRVLAGGLILLAVAQIVPFANEPASANLDVVPLLLAWVAVIPPFGAVETPQRRLLRVLIPAVAVAETLQVYPVPGSQMGIAAVVYVPVGVICLADALQELQGWSTARGTSAVQSFAAAVAVLAVAVPSLFMIQAVILPGLIDARNYHDQPKANLAGAELLHLPAPQSEPYEGVVRLLHEYHCSTFVGLPNINSLYLWAELESPSPQIPNGWPLGLNESQQQKAVEELRASRRPCFLNNEELSPLYLHGAPPPETPLVKYIEHNFHQSGKASGSFQLLLPGPNATTAKPASAKAASTAASGE
jgi:hypothetical protein